MTEVMENLPTVQETWIQSPGGGNSNSLQYSFLGNPMDRGTWLSTHMRARLICTHTYEGTVLIVLYFKL